MHLFTSWATGVMCGTKETPGFPTLLKYAILSTATGMQMGTLYTKMPKLHLAKNALGSAAIVGATYCVGNHFAKGVQWWQSQQKGPVQLKLL